MTRSEILRVMETAASLPAGTIHGDEALAGLEGWDSLTGVVFRVAVRDRWQISLSGTALSRCRTIPDILRLLERYLTA